MAAARPSRKVPAKALVALGVVACVVLLALVVDVGGPVPTGDVEAPTGPPTSAPLPSAVSRTAPGAVAAAVAFATSPQGLLYMSDDELRTAVTDMAAPWAADHLFDQVRHDVAAARSGLAGDERVWWLVRPLAYRLMSTDGNDAYVKVWVVSVLSAVEAAAPQAEWRTVEVDMTWTGGGWRLTGLNDRAGPTPMVGPGDRPWDAGRFDRHMAEFTRLDGEPVR